MRRQLTALLLALVGWGCFAAPAMAASDLLEVYFLPLKEAADAVKTQLSEQGRVAVVPSRRVLIVDDDRAHIDKAKQLLKRLDHPAGQYTVYVSLEDSAVQRYSQSAASVHAMAGNLTGGWVRLQAGRQHSDSRHRQSFQLRISGQQAASMETGTIQSFNRPTRLWLAGYGVVRADSVEMIPITSGFHVTVTPAGNDKVRVRITPWMQRATAQIRGRNELLYGLGTTKQPATPPSPAANMRLNALPELQAQPAIEIAGAATELVVPVDQSVTIAASSREAGRLGQALLSRYSSAGKRRFVIHFRVVKE